MSLKQRAKSKRHGEWIGRKPFKRDAHEAVWSSTTKRRITMNSCAHIYVFHQWIRLMSKRNESKLNEALECVQTSYTRAFFKCYLKTKLWDLRKLPKEFGNSVSMPWFRRMDAWKTRAIRNLKALWSRQRISNNVECKFKGDTGSGCSGAWEGIGIANLKVM